MADHKDIQALFDAMTQLQQQVITNVLKGMSPRQAYLHAPLGKASNVGSIDAVVSEMLRNPKVVAYRQAVQGLEHDETIMGRDEMRRRLTAIARTDINDLVELGRYEAGEDREGNPVYQTAWTFREEARRDPMRMSAVAELTLDRAGNPKVKLHSPLVAMKQLADLDGLEAPKRTELTGPNGGPLTVANFDTSDPIEAAKAYAQMIKHGV